MAEDKNTKNDRSEATRTARILEDLNLTDDAANVSRPKRAAALGGLLAATAIVANAGVDQLKGDNPLGLPRSTDPGSSVEHIVPIQAHESLPEDPKNTKVVVAKSGDTVWGLVREELGPETRIDDEVHTITEQLGEDGLQVGDKIEIPLEDQ